MRWFRYACLVALISFYSELTTIAASAELEGTSWKVSDMTLSFYEAGVIVLQGRNIGNDGEDSIDGTYKLNGESVEIFVEDQRLKGSWDGATLKVYEHVGVPLKSKHHSDELVSKSGFEVDSPTFVKVGVPFKVTITATNPFSTMSIGTIAASFEGVEVQLVSDPAFNVYHKGDKISKVEERGHTVFPAQFPLVEIFDRAWQPGNKRVLECLVIPSLAGELILKARTTFVVPPEADSSIGEHFNVPLVGNLDQQRFSCETITIDVSD